VAASENAAAQNGAASFRAELGGDGRRASAEQGPLMRFQVGLVEHGTERARQSGALEPRQEDLDALVDHAVAMARDAHRPAYEPAKNPNDRLREDRFERNMSRRGVLAEAEEHAEVSLRESELERARVPMPRGKPEVPVFLAAGAVLVLALTVTATLRDFMFASMEDDVLAWGLSVVMSLGFGVFLASSALSGTPHEEVAAAPRRGSTAVVGGIVVALALGAWRISGADGLGDVLTAIALTGLECGVIVILEWTGKRHEAAVRGWRARDDARGAVDAGVAAAQLDLARRRTELSRLDEAISEHVAYVEDRVFRNLAIEELSKAATTAVKDGYNAGVAANRGRTRGPRR
jgi:hypothetical protein